MPNAGHRHTRNLEVLERRSRTPRLCSSPRVWKTPSPTRGVARVAISGGSTPKGHASSCSLTLQPPFANTIPWDKLQPLLGRRALRSARTDADSNYHMTNENLLSKVALPSRKRLPHGRRARPRRGRHRKYESRPAQQHEARRCRVAALRPAASSAWATTATPPRSSRTPTASTSSAAWSSPTTSRRKDTWRITLTWPVINQAAEVAFRNRRCRQSRRPRRSPHRPS